MIAYEDISEVTYRPMSSGMYNLFVILIGEVIEYIITNHRSLSKSVGLSVAQLNSASLCKNG